MTHSDASTLLIVNPTAAAGRVRRTWRRFQNHAIELFGATAVRLTEAPGDATRWVREATQGEWARVVVVGGDGTFNEAINGLFDSETGAPLRPQLEAVLFPAGTGSDFSRSVGLAGRGEDRWRGTVRPIDVGRVTVSDREGRPRHHHFVNVSSFGSSGEIVARVNRTSKRLGGKASFFLGTVQGLAGYRNQRVRLQVDSHFEEELVVNMVAVGNGRYFGGGMKVTPQACLSDGLLDVVVVGDVALATFLRHAPKLYRGTHLKLPFVHRLQGRRVVATPVDPNAKVWVDADGEQPGRLPVTYEVLPGALRLYAPWEDAEALCL